MEVKKVGILDFLRKEKQTPKASAKTKKKGEQPRFYSLTGLIGIRLYVEEMKLTPSKFSPSGMDMSLKIRSMKDEEGTTRTDSTELILYFKSARLPLRGRFDWRAGSFDIIFIPC